MHKGLNEKLDALHAKKRELREARRPKKRSRVKVLGVLLGAVLGCGGVPAAVIAGLHAAGVL